MELYQLKSFVAVADAGHLTHAAERLHLSQPTVSGHIKALEQALDVLLFERTPAGMTLTAAGADLLPHARAMLGQADEIRALAMQLSGEVVGTLRLGSVGDPDFNRLGTLMALALQRHPRLRLELHHTMTGLALQELDDGLLDATFYFGEPPPPRFTALPLAPVVYRVAAPAAWRERVAGADLAALAAMPWIRTPAASSHSRLVQDLFAEHGVTPPPNRLEADNEAVMLALITSGVGLSLVRDDIARAQQAAGLVCLWAGAAPRTQLWFVHRAEDRAEPLVRALVRLVREVWRDPARSGGTGSVPS